MLTSLGNPRVKDVVRLRNRRHRDRERRFVIEGKRELAAAAAARFPLQTLFYCEDFLADADDQALIGQLAEGGAACEPASRSVFEKMSYRHTPDGLLAVACTPSITLDELPEPPPDSLWLIAAGIEKPGNLGAMLRSADAVGAHGVLVADPATDVFNPNVVRASVGALFSVAVAAASAPALRDWLAERRIRVLAASPDARTNYAMADFRGSVAVAVGSERAGLDTDWLDDCQTVRIPMLGRLDSINAAMAAAVLLFEAQRQRTHASSAG